MRPLIIGQAPSRESDPLRPVTGRCGEMIAELMGIDLRTYLRRHDRVNVFDCYLGKSGKGDRFPMFQAKIRALAIGREFDLANRRTVFLLGRNVARAFGLGRLDYLAGERVHKTDFYLIPHPSGINRWWNSASNRRKARRFLEGRSWRTQ